MPFTPCSFPVHERNCRGNSISGVRLGLLIWLRFSVGESLTAPSPREGLVPLLASSSHGQGREGTWLVTAPLSPQTTAFSRPPPGPAHLGLYIPDFPYFQSAYSQAPLCEAPESLPGCSQQALQGTCVCRSPWRQFGPFFL